MIRMIDIAEKAGVSRSTVSFVLNDSPQAKLIRPEVRERVRRVADELGYIPNQIARSMITGRTKVIGLISQFPEVEFIGLMLSGILRATEERDYFIKFMHRSKDEKSLVDKIREQRLDGVIISHYPSLQLDNLLKSLASHRIPVAILANSFPVDSGIRVVSDDVMGEELAVKHLVEYGHRNIAFLRSDSMAFTMQQREQGFRLGVKKYQPGTSPNIIDIADGDFFALIKAHPKTTGYVTPVPGLAVSLLKACRKHGVRVPEDISVVTYSHSSLTQLYDPPITTIDQHHTSMGYEAASHLIDAIESKDESLFSKPVNIELPVSLVKGETVAKVK